MYERQLLKELEALRSDVASAAQKVLPASGPPKPTVVLPLEDYRYVPPAPPTNSLHTPSPNVPTPPHTSFNTGVSTYSTMRPPHSSDPLAASQGSFGNTPQAAHIQSPSPTASTDPLSAAPSSSRSVSSTPQQILSPASTSSNSFQTRPLSPPVNRTSSPSPASPMQQPLSGTLTPRSPLHEQPLSGNLIDGTKSLYITPPSAASQPFDPLRSGPPVQSATSSPLQSSPTGSQQQSAGFNSFAQVRPHQMSQSMRVQPTRPRLDAREAASKLANMF